MKRFISSGFTLIELLIVIAVIGVLAIAVLAAVDPIEQLRRSRDTGKMADARELVNAYQRFYATKECFPNQWTNGTGCAGAIVPFADTTDNLIAGDLADLTTNTGELKASFLTKRQIAQGNIWVALNSAGVVSVCYNAESRNGQSGAMAPIGTLISAAGATLGNFTANSGATVCTPAATYVPDANVVQCMVCIQ